MECICLQNILKKQPGYTKCSKIYDILQQRSNISRSVTASYIQDTEYNTLSSYFMVHFIYRFSIFKGGAKQSDIQMGPGRGGKPHGPPPGGGRPF